MLVFDWPSAPYSQIKVPVHGLYLKLYCYQVFCPGTTQLLFTICLTQKEKRCWHNKATGGPQVKARALQEDGECVIVHYFSCISLFPPLAPQWKAGQKKIELQEKLIGLAAVMVVLIVLVIGTPLLQTPHQGDFQLNSTLHLALPFGYRSSTDEIYI